MSTFKTSNTGKLTPKKWRRIGNGCLLLSTSISGYAMAMDWPGVEFIVFTSGVAGKFLTSFFADEEK